MAVTATMPAAAMTPACRMPPPTTLRLRRTLRMNAALPTTTEPTGAARPLLKQRLALSAPCNSRAGETPSCTAAFHSRAPSTCSGKPWRWASSPAASM
jgi:hypothetical protein